MGHPMYFMLTNRIQQITFLIFFGGGQKGGGLI